jgi:enolase-phosphatase E1
VCTDVSPTLKKWHSTGLAIVIFSSGSVAAQQLFFTYVQQKDSVAATEDLNPLLKGYYDTVNAGPKHSPSSYEKIASTLGLEVARILFLSDNVKGTYGIA